MCHGPYDRGTFEKARYPNIAQGLRNKTLSIGDTYRYLGVEQGIQADSKAVKKRLFGICIKREWNIWSSCLNSRNKTLVHNIWIVSLYRHFCGTLEWTKKDLVNINRAMRKILRQYKCHHHNALLERLYLPM